MFLLTFLSIDFAKREKSINFAAIKSKDRKMKKTALSIAIVVITLLLGSCSSTKNVAYFQNIDSLSLAASKGLYDAHIMPKDELTITVSATDPKAVTPFNLSISNTLNSSGQVYSGAGVLQTYLVDNEGNINFPVIGKLHVQGLTKNQCEDMICAKIKPYLSESEKPIVTVHMASFRVTVMGEVTRPCVVPVGTEKMSILEALASAGDLTIYGKRDNVILIREDAQGQKHQHRLNLNDASIINSPYYYLQQNDIIYVEPNKVKAQNSSIGSATQIWLTSISILTSVASLVVSIVRH